MGKVTNLAEVSLRIKKGRQVDDLHETMLKQLDEAQKAKFNFMLEVQRQLVIARKTIEQRERRMVAVRNVNQAGDPVEIGRGRNYMCITVDSEFYNWACKELDQPGIDSSRLNLITVEETAFIMDPNIFSKTYPIIYPDPKSLFGSYHAIDFFETFFKNIAELAMASCMARNDSVFVGQLCCRKTGVVAMFSIYLDVIAHEYLKSLELKSKDSV